MPGETSFEEGYQESLSDAAFIKSELYFRRLLDKIPAGAYTCDAQGRITYYNQQALRLWGRAPKLNDSAELFCGSFRLYATDGSPLAHHQCWMALALKEGREYNGCEIVIEKPDGTRTTALAHAHPILDDFGNIAGAVNVLVDISERKRAEDALKAADQSKNAFLATLAHELRNPLAPLRNAAEILQLKIPAVPELQWALEVINRQMTQMTRLVDDLLDLGRITSNKLELRKDRVALSDLLRGAVEITQPYIQIGGQTLNFAEPAEPVFIDGDLARLTQVLVNLLHNAAKYTAQGGDIWLSTERQNGDIVIAVKDNGIGVASDVLPHIFDMFAQAQQSPERAPGGLGIGLTLAKRVVEVHGGTISAHSEGPSLGSEFLVRLPIIAAPTPDEHQTAEVIRATPASALRILVVDDNKDNADSLVMLLEIMGNEVFTARDGCEAMEIAEAIRPDVMVLDIGMPKLNGYETAQRVRQRPWGKNVVLIAFTGWGQDADRERSTSAGFDHHIIKPVDPQALMQLVSSLDKPGPASAP